MLQTIWFTTALIFAVLTVLCLAFPPKLQTSLPQWQAKSALWKWSIVCTLIVVAASAPKWGIEQGSAARKECEIWFCLDVSKSMLIDDLMPNRLTVAKQWAQTALRFAESQECGIVAFAGDARIISPPTKDMDFLRQRIEQLESATIPRGGSDLLAPIRLLAGRKSSKPAVLIFLSDGGHINKDLGSEVDQPGRENWTTIAVGLGSPDVDRALPGRAVAKRSANTSVRTRRNDAMMQSLADAGHGAYLPIGPEDSLVPDKIGGSIAIALLRTSGGNNEEIPRERFHWFAAAGLALGLWACGMSLGKRDAIVLRENNVKFGEWRRKPRGLVGSVSPNQTTLSSNAGKVTVALLMMALSPMGCERRTSTEIAFDSAVRDYETGELARSAEKFEKLALEPGELGVYSRFALANLDVLRSSNSAVSVEQSRELLLRAIRKYRALIAEMPDGIAWRDDARQNLELAKSVLATMENQPKGKQESQLDPGDRNREKEAGENSQGEPTIDDSQNSPHKKESKQAESKKDQGKVSVANSGNPFVDPGKIEMAKALDRLNQAFVRIVEERRKGLDWRKEPAVPVRDDY